jgi:hypothetical protein
VAGVTSVVKPPVITFVAVLIIVTDLPSQLVT